MNNIFVVIFSAMIAASAAPAEDGDAGIAGGSNAPASGIPYQVSLQVNGFHSCGGSILNNRWILTAAHCFDVSNHFTVVAGTNNYRQGGDRYNQIYYRKHELYNNDGQFHNDVALIKVDRDIAFNARVSPIRLPSQDMPGGLPLLMSGWGLTAEDSGSSEYLQVLHMTSATNAQCASIQPGLNWFEGHLCALPPGAGQGTCRGDSGGPLVYNNEVVGLLSAGFLHCGSGTPSVFARVFNYVGWINANMGQ